MDLSRRYLIALAFVSCASVGVGCTVEDAPSRVYGSHSSPISQDTSATDPSSGGTGTAGGLLSVTAASDPSAAGSDSSAGASSSAPLGVAKNGIATFYDADGTGNCSYPASPDALMVVAPNKNRYYDSAAICGACMKVTGAKGSVVVRVVDSCPSGAIDGDCGDSGADLDLSAQAFAQIDKPSKGKVNVTFQVVPCDVTGPIQISFKQGSSQWWTAIQIENHRLPIAKLEYDTGSGWTALPRSDDNYFTADSGVGKTPNGLKLRLTSSNGEVIEDSVPGVQDGATVTGTAQFQ